MLLIRDEQIAILSRAVRARFESEACEHVRRYFPDRCAALGEKGTLDAVRDGLSRAQTYGFQSCCDLLRFLNLLFQFGQEFERRDANAWARPYLESAQRSPTTQMDRLMEEAYRRLSPLQPEPVVEEEEEEDDEEAEEFDGIVWEPVGIDPNYVPKSIQPEYDPIDLRIAPGSVPLDQLPQPDDDDDEDVLIDPDEEEEEEGDGRR